MSSPKLPYCFIRGVQSSLRVRQVSHRTHELFLSLPRCLDTIILGLHAIFADDRLKYGSSNQEISRQSENFDVQAVAFGKPRGS